LLFQKWFSINLYGNLAGSGRTYLSVKLKI